MNSKITLVAIAALLVGGIAGAGLASFDRDGGRMHKEMGEMHEKMEENHAEMDKMMDLPSAEEMKMIEEEMRKKESSMMDMMQGMNDSLEGKSGKEFDMAFLQEMTIHHQGAVEMARAALERAENPELKAMATEIIAAQEKEIMQMQAWQTSWFLPPAPENLEVR